MDFKISDFSRFFLALLSGALFFILALFFYRVETRTLVLYYSEGCPHCKEVLNYIHLVKLRRPVLCREVYFNEGNYEEFLKIAKRLKVDTLRVPALYDPRYEKLFVGDQEVITHLEKIKK
ncbi:MAG: hypothetical protein ABIM42_02190 [candidate division WOR-3 bacterium]